MWNRRCQIAHPSERAWYVQLCGLAQFKVIAYFAASARRGSRTIEVRTRPSRRRHESPLIVLVAVSLSAVVGVAIERPSRSVGTFHALLTVYTLPVFVVTLLSHQTAACPSVHQLTVAASTCIRLVLCISRHSIGTPISFVRL